MSQRDLATHAQAWLGPCRLSLRHCRQLLFCNAGLCDRLTGVKHGLQHTPIPSASHADQHCISFRASQEIVGCQRSDTVRCCEAVQLFFSAGFLSWWAAVLHCSRGSQPQCCLTGHASQQLGKAVPGMRNCIRCTNLPHYQDCACHLP